MKTAAGGGDANRRRISSLLPSILLTFADNDLISFAFPDDRRRQDREISSRQEHTPDMFRYNYDAMHVRAKRLAYALQHKLGKQRGGVFS